MTTGTVFLLFGIFGRNQRQAAFSDTIIVSGALIIIFAVVFLVLSNIEKKGNKSGS